MSEGQVVGGGGAAAAASTQSCNHSVDEELADPAGETWRGTADGENGRKKKCS